MRKVIMVMVAMLLPVLDCMAQSPVVYSLSDTKAEYQPRNFYIVNVKDNRAIQDKLGDIKEGVIDLQGGVANNISGFLKKNIVQNTTSLPVTMQLNKLEIKEKAVGAKRQFELTLGIAYYTGTSKLIEYNGSSFAQSAGEAEKYIDKLLRDNITGNLAEFDKWVAANKNTISAEPVVEVSVVLTRNAKEEHHISYSKSRKLYMSDFEGTPDETSPGAAATMSGIGMNYEATTLRNRTKVSVTLSIYFDKSRSWMKPNGKNVTTLIHEQKHFDITAIKACELRALIEKTTFTPEGYKAELKALLNKVQQEGADMQNQYDRETEHGTLIDEQEAWNKKVDDMLIKQACY